MVCLEKVTARILAAGVILSLGVSLVGGAVYLVRQGGQPVDARVFEFVAMQEVKGWPEVLLIGILILILVPTIRVAVLGAILFKQRDYLYGVISLILFVLLCYGLY